MYIYTCILWKWPTGRLKSKSRHEITWARTAAFAPTRSVSFWSEECADRLGLDSVYCTLADTTWWAALGMGEIKPIYTLYSCYLLGPNPLLKGSNRGVQKKLGYHQHFPYDHWMVTSRQNDVDSHRWSNTVFALLGWLDALIWTFFTS